jgi:hypothetical protein
MARASGGPRCRPARAAGLALPAPGALAALRSRRWALGGDRLGFHVAESGPSYDPREMHRHGSPAWILLCLVIVGTSCTTAAHGHQQSRQRTLEQRACRQVGSYAGGQPEFSGADLEKIDSAVRVLRRSSVSGARKVADAIDKATSNAQRESALEDAFLWCSENWQVLHPGPSTSIYVSP